MRYALTIHLGMGGNTVGGSGDEREVAAPLGVFVGDNAEALENLGLAIEEDLQARERKYGERMFHDDLFTLVTAVDDFASADEITERIWQTFGAPSQPNWRLSDG